MKFKSKGFQVLPVLYAVGGGVVGELVMDQLDKQAFVATNPSISPLAVLAGGLAVQFFAPTSLHPIGLGMSTIAGVELTRKYTGMIKGILDDTFNRRYN